MVSPVHALPATTDVPATSCCPAQSVTGHDPAEPAPLETNGAHVVMFLDAELHGQKRIAALALSSVSPQRAAAAPAPDCQ